jgi:hypothetical protein
MRTTFILLLFIILLVGCANNNSSDPVTRVREIKKTDSTLLARVVMDSTTKQFGIKTTLTDTVIEFMLTNVSDINYKIDYIIPSCDCITARSSKKIVLPKETITIYTRFSPQKLNGYKGEVSKFVAVIGNSYPVLQNLFVRGVLK